jgi:hypothetical protein
MRLFYRCASGCSSITQQQQKVSPPHTFSSDSNIEGLLIEPKIFVFEQVSLFVLQKKNCPVLAGKTQLKKDTRFFPYIYSVWFLTKMHMSITRPFREPLGI